MLQGPQTKATRDCRQMVQPSAARMSSSRIKVVTEDALHGACAMRPEVQSSSIQRCAQRLHSKKKTGSNETLLPVEFFNCGLCRSLLQHRSCELVLIVDDDVSLLNAYIHGVFAVIVPHTVSMASASHMFAPAWWHADLNINAFWSATVARVITGTRIINLNDLGNGTRVHFPLVDVPNAGKQRLRRFVNIHGAVQNVSTDCWPKHRAGYRRDGSQVGCNCRTSDTNGQANACQLSESFHCLSFRLV
jgi:hypothetical protein